MNAQEYREMNLEELEAQLKEERTQIVEQRFNIGSRQLKNYKKLSDTKKEIARILTVMRQKKEESVKGEKDNKDKIS